MGLAPPGGEHGGTGAVDGESLLDEMAGML
jgi:hypothetical protein